MAENKSAIIEPFSESSDPLVDSNKAEESVSLNNTQVFGGGAVIFFPEETKRPSEGRFVVAAGKNVSVCLKLNPLNSPFLKEILSEARGFEIILEDSETPPNELIVRFEALKKQPFQPNALGCYVNEFIIPEETKPGIYQVADLLAKTRIQDYVSLRQILFQFTQADEIEVENSSLDQKTPELIEISSFKEQRQNLGKYGEFLKLKLEQNFLMQEEGSGIKPNGLNVYYQLKEEGHSTGIYPATCKRVVRTYWKFTCRLEITRPLWQWRESRLSLILESILLQDKAGNAIKIQDPKIFAQKAKGEPIFFEYEGIRHGPGHIPPHKNRYQESKSRQPKVEQVK